MCWDVRVLHLCRDNCSCFLEIKILFKQYTQLTWLVRLSDEWTFKRELVVEHNAHENFPNTCSQKKLITLELSFYASSAAGKTAIEIVRFTTFVERATIWIA